MLRDPIWTVAAIDSLDPAISNHKLDSMQIHNWSRNARDAIVA